MCIIQLIGRLEIYRIKIDGFKCLRCGHEWAPRDIAVEPVICPKCKSPYWNKPKQKFKKGEGKK